MKSLKPCPFCGGKPIIRRGVEGWFYVTCLDPGCSVVLHTCIRYTEKEAVDVWNTRAESQIAYWIKHEGGRVLECSACGSIYRNSGISEVKLKGKKVFDYEEPRFCLHCGARMKE
jgi:Lar family restriction alleviation protein